MTRIEDAVQVTCPTCRLTSGATVIMQPHDRMGHWHQDPHDREYETTLFTFACPQCGEHALTRVRYKYGQHGDLFTHAHIVAMQSMEPAER